MSAIHIIKSIVNPSAAPDRVGQHWINTVTKQTFFSVGTATVADWTELGVDGSIVVEDESVELTAQVNKINFAGAGVTVTEPVPNQVLVTIPAGGGSVSIEDEGVELTPAATKINFVGAGVTVTEPNPNEVEVNIAGGGGGSPVDPNYVDSTPMLFTENTLHNVWEDVSGASLTITPTAPNEKYEICVEAKLGLYVAAGAFSSPTQYLRIVDSLGNLVDNAQTYFRKQSGVSFLETESMSLVARVTVSVPTTYKLQIKHTNDASIVNANFTTWFLVSDAYGANPSKFFAKRVSFASGGGGGGIDPDYITSTPVTTSIDELILDTWTDVSGASLTITPTEPTENWEIYAECDVYTGLDVAGGGVVMFTNARIANSSNALVDNAQKLSVVNLEDVFHAKCIPMTMIARVTLSAAETFKLQFRHFASAGGNPFTTSIYNNANVTGSITDPDTVCKFWAKRIY